MELACKPGRFVVAGECWSVGQVESGVLDIPAELRPSPAPPVFAGNSLEALIGRAVVVNDRAVNRRVLFENCDNYENDVRLLLDGLPTNFGRYHS